MESSPSSSNSNALSSSSVRGTGKKIKVVFKGRKRKRPTVPSAGKVPRILSSNPRCADGTDGDKRGTIDDINSTTSRHQLREQEEDQDDEFPQIPDVPIECDTLLAIQSLIRRSACALCPSPPSGSGIPFVLRRMVNYALLSSSSDNGGAAGRQSAESNRRASAEASTGVNVELDELAQTNRIRMVELQGTGEGSDLAVLTTEDFVRGVWDAFESSRWKIAAAESAAAAKKEGEAGIVPDTAGANRKGSTSPSEEDGRAMVEWFVSHLSEWTRTCVSGEEIHALLKGKYSSFEGNTKRGTCVALRKPTVVVDYLISLGLLLPRRGISSSVRRGTSCTSDSSVYAFSLPGLGTASRVISSGRQRMVLKLKRSAYKELKRSVLESEGAGKNSMSGLFHVRDLLSRGVTRTREMPSGQFICLAEP